MARISEAGGNGEEGQRQAGPGEPEEEGGGQEEKGTGEDRQGRAEVGPVARENPRSGQLGNPQKIRKSAKK